MSAFYELIQSAAGRLMNMHSWNDYKNENGLAYYYAEGGLYVIKDGHTGAYSFIYADSPDDALKIYKTKMSKGGKGMDEIETKIAADAQELEDASDLVEEVGARLSSVVPNITIRNNQAVYVTINNFNATVREWSETSGNDQGSD